MQPAIFVSSAKEMGEERVWDRPIRNLEANLVCHKAKCLDRKTEANFDSMSKANLKLFTSLVWKNR